MAGTNETVKGDDTSPDGPLDQQSASTCAALTEMGRILDVLGAKSGGDAARLGVQRITAIHKRLVQSNAREATLREENEKLLATNKELTAKVAEMQATIDSMQSHPSVIAAKRAAIEAEIAEKQRQLASLKPQKGEVPEEHQTSNPEFDPRVEGD